jgi:hypothetical protein
MRTGLAVAASVSVLVLVFVAGLWNTGAPASQNSMSTQPVSPNVLGGGAVAASRSHPEIIRVVPEPAGTPSGCANATFTDPYPEIVSANQTFNGNLFALPSGSVGSTSLCYNSQTKELSDSTDFTSLPGAPRYGVLGYPESILGQNLWGGISGSPNSMMPLPDEKVQNLTSRDLWAVINYSVNAPGKSPYDFAFDDWFSQYQATSSSTGNEGNRIEVMIWLSNDIGMYLNQTKVDIPTFLNYTTAPGTWYRDDICQSSDFLTFDYLFAPTGKTPGYGYQSGHLAFNLTAILDNVASVVKGGICWAPKGTSIGGLYVDNFPIGAEFYPTTSDTAQVSWTVSRLCYRFVRGTPAENMGCW